MTADHEPDHPRDGALPTSDRADNAERVPDDQVNGDELHDEAAGHPAAASTVPADDVPG